MGIVIAVSLMIYTGLAVVRPAIAVAIILAALPAYQIRFPIGGIPSTFLEWLILALAFATFIKSFHKFPDYRERFIKLWHKFPLLVIFAIIFLIASALNILVSPQPLRALGIFKAYFLEGGIFFILCLLHLDTQKKLNNALKALGILLFVLSIFGLYQFFTLYRLPPAWWGPGTEPRRVVSLFTYPNAVSLLITPILAFFTSLLTLNYKSQTTLPRHWLVTVIIAGLTLLIITFSRGAWLGYLGALCFLLLFTPYRKKFLIVLVSAVLLLLLLPQTRARLMPAFTGTDPAGLERFKLIKSAWEIIKTSPIFGSGLMGFRDWYGALKQNNTDEILNYPHNFFLNFWLETGFFGLLAVIGLLINTAYEAYKLYKKSVAQQTFIIAVLSAWIALLIHGQFDVPFFKNDLAVLFWFLLAVIPVLSLLSEGNATANDNN